MKEKETMVNKILLLVIPVYLKIDSSFLFINFMKKNKVETKKINGSISYNKEGPFNTVKIMGVAKDVSLSFKKLDSSIRFMIKTKTKKIVEIKTIFFKNFLKRYFLYVVIKI